MSTDVLTRAMESFLRQMAADGRSPGSIRSYRRELIFLSQFLGTISTRSITVDILNKYLTSSGVQTMQGGEPKQTSTINRTKSVMRAFFRWCQQTGVLKQNPAAHIRLVVTAALPTPYMTRTEIARFLHTISESRNSLAARDYALFATLAYTGIRLSEVVRVRSHDVDIARRMLQLQRTKGGRQERRHLPAVLRRILSRYISKREQNSGNDDGILFVSQLRKPLSARALQYRFRFWLRRARIRKQLSVHSLRHTFGTLLYRATRDLVLVSHALGHKDLKSTLRYTHQGDDALARAVNMIW